MPIAAKLTRHSIANAKQAVAWIDSVVFAAFFLAVAMPYSNLVVLPTSFNKLSGYEIIYILITCLLLLKILLLGKIRFVGMAALYVSTVVLYVAVSVIIRDAILYDVLRQLETSWAFAIALLLLAAGTNADLHKFFRYAAGAMIVSGGSALILFHYFYSYAQKIYAQSPWDLQLMNQGRMLWEGQTDAIFIVLYFLVQDEYSRINRILAGIALAISLTATFNTQSRTNLMAMLALLVASLLVSSGLREAWRRTGQMIGISLLFAAAARVLLITNESFKALADKRFLGGGMGAEKIYQVDLELIRMELYRQYWNSITEHFPWGQGFGFPYSSIGKWEIPVTDITLMSFILPLGVFGLVIFGLFIRILWCTVSQASAKMPLKYGRIIKALIVISLLVSLNVDIFTRNTFVVMLVLLILCMDNSASKSRLGRSLSTRPSTRRRLTNEISS